MRLRWLRAPPPTLWILYKLTILSGSYVKPLKPYCNYKTATAEKSIDLFFNWSIHVKENEVHRKRGRTRLVLLPVLVSVAFKLHSLYKYWDKDLFSSASFSFQFALFDVNAPMMVYRVYSLAGPSSTWYISLCLTSEYTDVVDVLKAGFQVIDIHGPLFTTSGCPICTRRHQCSRLPEQFRTVVRWPVLYKWPLWRMLRYLHSLALKWRSVGYHHRFGPLGRGLSTEDESLSLLSLKWKQNIYITFTPNIMLKHIRHIR